MLDKIRQERIKKVEELEKMGIDPYPSKANRTHYLNEIVQNFEKLENSSVTVVGRLMSFRDHGELAFGDLQDNSGKVQIYIKKDVLKNTDSGSGTLGFDDLRLIDIGDFLEVAGTVTKTKRGEISILISALRIMSKSIRPLPEKWSGLKDKEARYRRRYLDMTMDPEIRQMFVRRSKFWKSVREFMDGHGFYEVNTPVLEHTTGGADARPFETYYDALGENFYLRISHELPLKRLLGAGFEKVYDLGPRFRNEGFSEEHLPEHIAMEWYWAYADYRDGMDFTEELFKQCLKDVYGKLKFEVYGQNVDLDQKWERIDFADIVQERFGVDVFDDSEEKLLEVYLANGGDKNTIQNRSRLSDGLWKLIRPTIAGPVFLTGVPKFLSPLSKANHDDPRKTDRFHPIIAGSELANAFSELNDPQDQLDRFLEQQAMRDSGDSEAHMLDIDFVEMLEYGMPPAVGFGMSERVFWAFEGVTAREGVPFPPMKRQIEDSTKEIYGDRVKFEKTKSGKPKSSNDSTGQTKSGSQIQDKSKKFIIVLNKEVSGWQLTNTIGHICAYLGNKVANPVESTPTFETQDGKTIPADSQYPVVTLTANPGQMLNLLEKVEATDGVTFLAYTQDMIDFANDKELAESIKKTKKSDLKILGVGMFGDIKVLDGLTKKFSLFH